MIDVTLTVGNAEISPLLSRLDAFKSQLAEEMMTPNPNDPKMRSATITHAFVGRLARRLREHQSRLVVLEKEAKRRR